MAVAKNNATLALKVVVVIAVFCVLSELGLSQSDINLYPKTIHVIVMNSLGPQNVLSVHCKSADNDLGQKDVVFNQQYEWSFKLQVFDRTLFWCNAWWYDHGKLVSKNFDIFKAPDMDHSCGPSHTVCHRKFQFDGIYFEKEDGSYSKSFDWSRS
ncbi:hypothetical protein AQUCO_06600035v1 [Aquilegia coerulea]|uniref:S-protein homolog n=1 Tax=Aquilegia coerulea TaxID=218851 RepID=A0A2G5CC13_AQUCA|nr:hypothetical protein AQUCO_06600035v1 [Aquilegia coerulea]